MDYSKATAQEIWVFVFSFVLSFKAAIFKELRTNSRSLVPPLATTLLIDMEQFDDESLDLY